MNDFIFTTKTKKASAFMQSFAQNGGTYPFKGIAIWIKEDSNDCALFRCLLEGRLLRLIPDLKTMVLFFSGPDSFDAIFNTIIKSKNGALDQNSNTTYLISSRMPFKKHWDLNDGLCFVARLPAMSKISLAGLPFRLCEETIQVIVQLILGMRVLGLKIEMPRNDHALCFEFYNRVQEAILFSSSLHSIHITYEGCEPCFDPLQKTKHSILFQSFLVYACRFYDLRRIDLFWIKAFCHTDYLNQMRRQRHAKRKH